MSLKILLQEMGMIYRCHNYAGRKVNKVSSMHSDIVNMGKEDGSVSEQGKNI